MMIEASLNLLIAIITLLVCLHRTAEHGFFRKPHYYKILCAGALVSLGLLLPLVLPYSSDKESLCGLLRDDNFIPIMFGPLVLGCLAQACLSILRLRWPRLLPGYFEYSFFTVFITGSALVYVAILWFLTFDWGTL